MTEIMILKQHYFCYVWSQMSKKIMYNFKEKKMWEIQFYWLNIDLFELMRCSLYSKHFPTNSSDFIISGNTTFKKATTT